MLAGLPLVAIVGPDLTRLTDFHRPTGVAEARPLTAMAAPPGDPLRADADLAAKGDPAATERLLRAVQSSLVRAVGSVLGGRHHAIEDVVQESMVKLVRGLPSFRGESKVLTYATNIAVRTGLDWARKDARTRRLQEAAELQQAVMPSQGEGPDRRAASRALVLVLLENLSDKQAEALVLRTIFGFTVKEVADVLDTPVETIRSRIRLARHRLDEALRSDPQLAQLRGAFS
ncbi:MAG: RNA polymerase sigma factor [Myxococcota bacterium]